MYFMAMNDRVIISESGDFRLSFSQGCTSGSLPPIYGENREWAGLSRIGAYRHSNAGLVSGKSPESCLQFPMRNHWYSSLVSEDSKIKQVQGIIVFPSDKSGNLKLSVE